MVFKETKGNKTVEACVMPAPGGMFKGGGLKSEVQHLSHIRCRNARKKSVPATST
jgi:hypothetical protein